MKNIKRKSIALLMAIAMIISCTAAVSAAEAVTPSTYNSESTVYTIPRDTYRLTDARAGNEVAFSGSFTSNYVGNIFLGVQCNVSGTVTLRGPLGYFRLIDFGASPSSVQHLYFGDNWPAGIYYYTVTFPNNPSSSVNGFYFALDVK